jgi:hypothetical protein
MISKLNADSLALIEVNDTTKRDLAFIDSTDSITPADSFPSINIDIWRPYEITYVGIMPMENYWLKQPWEICEVTMGFMVQSGSMTIEPEVEQFIKAAVQTTQTPTNTFTPFQPTPRPKDTTDPSHFAGISPEGSKQFNAFIHPNPITASSRLYIVTNESIDLNITIHSAKNQSVVHAGSSTLFSGSHEMDLKLYALNQGDYILRLASDNQVSNLNFVV